MQLFTLIINFLFLCSFHLVDLNLNTKIIFSVESNSFFYCHNLILLNAYQRNDYSYKKNLTLHVRDHVPECNDKPMYGSASALSYKFVSYRNFLGDVHASLASSSIGSIRVEIGLCPSILKSSVVKICTCNSTSS